MSTPAIAWTLRDGGGGELLVHLLLVDRYYIIGTQWPSEKTKWLTKRYEDSDAAAAYAVKHTGTLEKQAGDTLEEGPYYAMLLGQPIDLDGFVDRDEESAQLAHIFDQVMDAGVAA